MPTDATRDQALDRFWEVARQHADLAGVPVYTGENPVGLLRPPAWAFGGSPQQADRLLALVLDGTKTATASARADYDAESEELPEPGTLGIVLDGAGHPRALVVTTEVSVVPFGEVGEDHARAEGEGDRTLASWRRDHERFFAEHAAGGFSPDMPVVLERFRRLYP